MCWFSKTGYSSGVNYPATGIPTISGVARVDEILTVDTSDISDSAGFGAFSY